MKKMTVLAAVALLVVPALAFGANPTAGKYTGKITSIVADLNNKTVTGEVTTTANGANIKVTYPDGTYEVWSLVDGKTLDQTEFDKAGKAGQKYGATFTNGKYYINCKDKAKNECDAGIDARQYWVVTATGNGFTYEGWGVGKENTGKPEAQVAKRFTFNFTPAK